MNNTINKLTNNDFEVIKFEKCVSCNIETEVPVNQNIELRYFYIEGAGQLCATCFDKQMKYGLRDI